MSIAGAREDGGHWCDQSQLPVLLPFGHSSHLQGGALHFCQREIANDASSISRATRLPALVALAQVESFKERLLANNDQTHWVPDFVKEKRFRNWLENARDWAVSRNRFWGTPIPMWISDDGKEVR